MCDSCDYKALLTGAGLKVTPHRLAVLELLGRGDGPLSAGQVHARLSPGHPLDRVTVYRTLEALCEKGLARRLRTGGRTCFYHLACPEHPPHPHFYCTMCGELSCLSQGAVKVDLSRLGGSFPGRVSVLNLSLEGVCPACLKN